MKLVFRPGGRYGLCPEKKSKHKVEKNKLTKKLESVCDRIRIPTQISFNLI